MKRHQFHCATTELDIHRPAAEPHPSPAANHPGRHLGQRSAAHLGERDTDPLVTMASSRVAATSSYHAESLRMKTIGVLGGMSSVASAEYYRRINEGVNAHVGGHAAADLVL